VEQVQQVQQEQIILPIGAVVRNVNGDRYIVEGLLGKGGSGAVYLVKDKRDKEALFALKEMIDPDKIERERFAFEAEVLMQLEHEALPHVYRVFENEKLKRIYILMDYIDGQDLEVLRQEQPDKRFHLPLVLNLLSPVVDALNYMHQRKPPIVHRDLKPSNIIVPVKGGDAMLVDFGIAKEYVADGTTTVVRHGTPGYAALEQYGGGTNTRTDVYGLGATLYTLLTGTIPLDALTRATGSQGVDPLKSVHELVPTIPIGVSEAIQHAMRFSRDDRFDSVEEFWQEVKAQAEPKAAQEGGEAINKKAPDVSLPASVPVQRERKNIATTTLLQQRATAQRKKKYIRLSIILALLALLIVGASVAFSLLRSPHPISHAYTSTFTPSTSTPTATATHRPLPNTSGYPVIANSYAGTALDLLHGTKTNIYLSSVVQNKGRIQGDFSGLSQSGPFTGSVDKAEKVQFDVKIYGGQSTISFIGGIQIGNGVLGGSFKVFQNGQYTGEYGSWTASPTS